jgi:molybdate transport system ATP-binding protein
MTLRAAFEVPRRDLTVAIELEVDDGEVVALLGPNGAGKTTALEAIAGIVPLSSGSVVLDGERIDTLSPDRRRVGLAFQDGMLFPRMSAVENVAFPMRARGTSRAEALGRARTLLGRIAEDVPPDAKPPALSGGERQRVALARTLAAEPRALLLDEPLAAVDASARPVLRTTIREALAPFAGPAILVTHEPVEAMTLADRIAVLEAGRITQVGTPADIRTHPRTRYAADLVGVNLFEGRLVPERDGSGTLATGDGDLAVPWPEHVPPAPRDGVQATVAPMDVALHEERPEGSARNVFHGRIVEVVPLGGRARVRLATRPPLVAEVTAGSVERMRLEPGREVWASCKAVEVRLMVQGVEPDTL